MWAAGKNNNNPYIVPKIIWILAYKQVEQKQRGTGLVPDPDTRRLYTCAQSYSTVDMYCCIRQPWQARIVCMREIDNMFGTVHHCIWSSYDSLSLYVELPVIFGTVHCCIRWSFICNDSDYLLHLLQ